MKVAEFTLDEGNADTLRLLLQSFLHNSESNSNMFQNHVVVTTKGRPKNKDSRCRLAPRAYWRTTSGKNRQLGKSITSLERLAVSIVDTITDPPGDGVILHHVLDNGHTRQCRFCRRSSVISTDHNARTCPLRAERPTIRPLHELSLQEPQDSQAT